MTLTNRELASLILLTAVSLLAFRKSPGVLTGLLTALKNVLHIFALFALWMAGVIYLGNLANLWEPSLFKDTLIWFGAGFALVVASTDAGKEERFFRRRGLEPLGLAAVIGLFVNSASLDLLPELVLQVLVVVVIVWSAMAGRAGFPERSRVLTVLWVVVGLGVFVPPLVDLLQRLDRIDLAATVRFLLLPVWMTAGALPFMYVIALLFAFAWSFKQLDLAAERHGRRAPYWMKVAVLSAARLSPRGANRFNGMWAAKVVETSSFREARDVLTSFRAEAQAREAARTKAAADLVRFAGVPGVDAEGRQLDRREFTETARALELLDAFAAADYRDGEYRSDVADRQGGHMFDLPDDHGLNVEVSDSGKSYRAWRRTPSGWCFAIGRSGKASFTHYCDGPEPPTTFPTNAPPWSDTETSNWPVDDL